MNQFKYPWEKECLAAILETDNCNFANLSATARATILNRIDELNMTFAGTPEEREALAAALARLQKLKIERLGGS